MCSFLCPRKNQRLRLFSRPTHRSRDHRNGLIQVKLKCSHDVPLHSHVNPGHLQREENRTVVKRSHQEFSHQKVWMQTLTASLLRRSCSFLRAVSRSLSTENCVISGCVSTGDFGICSASLGLSTVASVQIFSGESGSSLIGCGVVSALQRPGKLEGKVLVNRGILLEPSEVDWTWTDGEQCSLGTF